MSCDASILKEIEHLNDLTDAERAALAQRIDLDSYPAGHTIFEFGDPGHALYIVRKGEVETISYNRDKGVGITVYIGQRRGHASSADFSADAIKASVGKALAIARYTADAWRARVYAVRYFITYVISGAAITMIAFLHSRGGFDLVLTATAVIAMGFVAGTAGVALLVNGVERESRAVQPAE